jgi:hypothetical protein
MKGEQMNGNRPIAIQVQKFLGGIDYPASKEEIVRTATDAGAGDEVLNALEGLPEREYDGPTAVSEAVSG